MRIRPLNLILGVMITSGLCISSGYATPKAEATPTLLKAAKAEVIRRGEPLSSTPAINLDQVATNPKKYTDKTVMITGTASAVCKKKGCWMILSGTTPSSTARVTFKDYSFFVPKDSSGMRAKIEGQVKVKVMSQEERQHLADDEKVDVSKVPKVELRIIAQGVELYK